mmetsp:Transcript_363/g.1223  ORF Transcript_363/g.1223 Transcript_363/m.1223 type:complete len:158 (+) Transcript_363:478-951(+)
MWQYVRGPIVATTHVLTDNFALGSGRVMSRLPSKSGVVQESIPLIRFATMVVNGKVCLFISYELSVDETLFTLIAEADSRRNAVTDGTIVRRTEEVFIDQVGCDQRNFDFCMLRGEPCNCTDKSTQMCFETWRRNRYNVFEKHTGVDGVLGLAFIGS